MQLVWFKRDLRVYDHAALAEAARRGPVLPLYIAEPGYWSQPDASGRHWAFIAECPEVVPDVDDGDDRFGYNVDSPTPCHRSRC